MIKTSIILFVLFYLVSAHSQQTIDKLNSNQLKLPKESTSKALILDATGQIKSSASVSDTELSYLDGLTDTLSNLLSGKEPSITSGTTSQYFRGDKTFQTLDKSAVGLSNVDNTSDANKPVSTAQQTALNLKADDSVVVKLTGNQSISGVKTFTGKIVASTTANGAIPCPVMNQTQRDAFTASQGDCVYNTTALQLNIYDGTTWKAAGGSGGISLWLTGTSYAINDVVIQSDKIYRCLTAHTSGTFATDLAASRWVEVSASPTTPYSLANGGTNNALTASNGGIVWVDADSFEILAPGTSGQVLQSNATASPSWVNKSVSGKADSSAAITLEEIQVSNNQLTQTAANKHKLETGNKNILVNPSFEHSTFSTGWTNSAGTFTEETVLEIDGLKAAKLVLSAQTMSLTQSSTLYASQFADGVQGLAMVRVKSDVALKVCAIQAGVVSTSLCVDVPAHNKWGLYKVPFILGATSNGISIASTGSVTGTVYIDDAFIGAVDLSVNGSTVYSESYFAVANGTGVAGDVASLSVIGTSTLSTLLQTPTIVSGNIQVIALDTSLVSINAARQDTNNLSTIIITKNGTTYTSISSVVTSNSPGVGGGSIQIPVVKNDILLVNFGGQSTVNAYVGFTATKLTANEVYTSNNANVGWTSYTPTLVGFGTTSSSEFQWRREGDSVSIRGVFVCGTSTAVAASYTLPNSITAKILASQSVWTAGRWNRSLATGSVRKGSNLLVSQSQNLVNFGNDDYTTAQSAFTAQLGSNICSSGDVIEVEQHDIPITGWEQSNIIIGSFNGLQSCTDTLACTDTFSASIDSSGNVSQENVNWLNGNCGTATSGVNTDYTCGYVTSLVTQPMNCVTVDSSPNTNPNATRVYTSSSIQFQASNLIGRGIRVICQKQGADYIGKTVMAAASDQNLKTPGAIGVDNFSFSFGTTNKTTVCSASPCSYLDQIGNVVTSLIRGGVGTYSASLSKTYSKIKCTKQFAFLIAGQIHELSFPIDVSNSSTINFNVSISSTGGLVDTYGTINCIGIP